MDGAMCVSFLGQQANSCKKQTETVDRQSDGRQNWADQEDSDDEEESEDEDDPPDAMEILSSSLAFGEAKGEADDICALLLLYLILLDPPMSRRSFFRLLNGSVGRFADMVHVIIFSTIVSLERRLFLMIFNIYFFLPIFFPLLI